MQTASKRAVSLILGFTCLFALNLTVQASGGSSRSVNMISEIQPGNVMHESEDGVPLVDKMIAAANLLDNYSCEYSMTVYKERTPQTETGIFYFRKPRLLRVEVRSGPKKGSLGVLEADGKVHGHLGGALKYFSGALSPDNHWVLAINDFPLVGTDFGSLASYLRVSMLDKGDHARASKTPVLTSRSTLPVFVLEMVGGTGQQELKKRLYVDPKTLLPVFWEDYRNGKLWSESFWQNFKGRLTLDEKLFKV